jgi:hypothetical protein
MWEVIISGGGTEEEDEPEVMGTWRTVALVAHARGKKLHADRLQTHLFKIWPSMDTTYLRLAINDKVFFSSQVGLAPCTTTSQVQVPLALDSLQLCPWSEVTYVGY